ncbi:MAG TPA: ABC transporter substrate-binding protein [Gaiellaceae bacterium]|nr:ABC transporter substrate-binding protein [Gaiellaceae bacterium]
MIKRHTTSAANAALVLAIAATLALGLFAGTARPATDVTNVPPTVVIGTKNFPEEYILGELYKQALQAKGFTVSYKQDLGSTEIIQTALTSNKINFYPEYTGVIVQDVFHHALSATTSQGTYQLAKQLEGAKGFTLLNPTPFYDTDAIAVTNATAKKYGLKTITDLKKIPTVTLGALPEFKTRNTGLVGLENIYGVKNVSFVSLGSISPYAALDSGKVLAADVFSTDPVLGPGSKYTVLSDPKNLFGFQNVAPVVSTSLATAAGSTFASVINQVSSKLTQSAIVALNKAVEVDKQSPAAVAKAFLQANGLLT